MKKKFIDWLNGVVDRAIQSEAWANRRDALDRLETIRERCEVYEDTIFRRNAEITRLKQQYAELNLCRVNAEERAVKYACMADELEARIANALT